MGRRAGSERGGREKLREGKGREREENRDLPQNGQRFGKWEAEGRKKTQTGKTKLRLQRGNRNPEGRHSTVGMQDSTTRSKQQRPATSLHPTGLKHTTRHCN